MPSSTSWMDDDDPARLLHALDVHRAELELQNLALRATLEELAAGNAALTVARDRFRAIHDGAPVPYLTLGAERAIVECNQAAVLLFGTPRERLLGASVDRLFDDFSRRGFRDFVDEVFAAGRGRSPDLRVMLAETPADAAPVHVLIDGVVIRSATDEPPLCVLALVDISARKALETARRKAQDEVLAIVSHDLRGPLNTVVLACDALRSSPGPAEREDCLAQIERAALRSVRLIKDLLGVVHIESGELRLERSWFDLGELAQQLCSDYRLVAVNAGCRLTYAVGDGDLAVLADRDRLHQVGANLITNALVHARGAAVEVSAVAVGDGVMFAVTDQGPGIPLEDQPRVFDRFRKAGRARDGAGLGLTIVKGLVAAHGGTITLISSPGQGARFEILLPHGAP